MSAGAALAGAAFGALALAGCQSLDLDWTKERSGAEPAAVAGDPAEMRMAEAMAGSRPPAPVMVGIDVEDEPVIFVLRDIGLQAEGRALLTTDAGRMVVRLDWIGPKAGTESAAPSGDEGS